MIFCQLHFVPERAFRLSLAFFCFRDYYYDRWVWCLPIAYFPGTPVSWKERTCVSPALICYIKCNCSCWKSGETELLFARAATAQRKGFKFCFSSFTWGYTWVLGGSSQFFHQSSAFLFLDEIIFIFWSQVRNFFSNSSKIRFGFFAPKYLRIW